MSYYDDYTSTLTAWGLSKTTLKPFIRINGYGLLTSNGLSSYLVIRIANYVKPLCITIGGHSEQVKTVSVSNDGKYIVSCSFTTIKVWDINTGKNINTMNGRYFGKCCFSSDGRIISRFGTPTQESAIRRWKATPTG